MLIVYIVVAVIAYCIGSISFSIIFSKKFAGVDVRESGSKNAGTTNVLRTVGKKAALYTLVCDILKGVVAVFVAFIAGKIFAPTNEEAAILIQIAGVAVVLGHMFPVFFQFRGGKGIATSIGILFVMNWQIGLICLLVGIVLIALTRMVSLGSITAGILFPILTIFIDKFYLVPDASYLIFGIIIAVIVVYNHRENIQRIMNGTENKISFKK